MNENILKHYLTGIFDFTRVSYHKQLRYYGEISNQMYVIEHALNLKVFQCWKIFWEFYAQNVSRRISVRF